MEPSTEAWKKECQFKLNDHAKLGESRIFMAF